MQKIDMGYCQRPADPAGLINWAEKLDAGNGNLSEIIEAFANSKESQDLYGTITNDTIFRACPHSGRDSGTAVAIH